MECSAHSEKDDALTWAARCGHSSCIKTLIDAGASVINALDYMWKTALDVVISMNRHDCVKMLTDAVAAAAASVRKLTLDALISDVGAIHTIRYSRRTGIIARQHHDKCYHCRRQEDT